MNKRYSFCNWFEVDKKWKDSFQIKEFFPDNRCWKYSNFFPSVTFFSVFGDRKNINRNHSKVKIFWTGEDVTINHSSYSDNCINDCDLSIGFIPEDKVKSENYIRYPLWLLYYFGMNKTYEEVKKSVDEFNAHWMESVSSKKKFCSLVASHDSFGTRKKLYDIISSYEKVSCAGRIFHNDDSLLQEYGDNKTKYLESFVYNLCPENVSAEGYTTEKIFQSFASGCIPIYYGSNGVVEPEVVDNSRIIFFDGNNGDDVLHKVIDLYENRDNYLQFMATPPLLKTASNWIYEKNLELSKKLKEVLC